MTVKDLINVLSELPDDVKDKTIASIKGGSDAGVRVYQRSWKRKSPGMEIMFWCPQIKGMLFMTVTGEGSRRAVSISKGKDRYGIQQSQ